MINFINKSFNSMFEEWVKLNFDFYVKQLEISAKRLS